MSSMNMAETFDQMIPMVNLISILNIILGLLPLVVSIVTLVLVIKIYRRKSSKDGGMDDVHPLSSWFFTKN